jgi:hypothetical protein
VLADRFEERMAAHLGALTTFPDRHVGGPGNLAATRIFAETVASFGFEVDRTPFDCIDWVNGSVVLLLRGEVAKAQIMPKGFTFYNPDSHRRLVGALESAAPAAVIAATGRDPQMVGSQYPFPLFEDGDLEFPNAYMKDTDGERRGSRCRLGAYRQPRRFARRFGQRERCGGSSRPG